MNDAATLKVSGLARMEVSWAPPSPSWMKLNTNAAIGNNGWVSLAAVLRVHEGNIRAAMAFACTTQLDLFHAEYLAFYDGLKWLRRFSSNRLHIELDAMNVVGALLSGREMSSSTGSRDTLS